VVGGDGGDELGNVNSKAGAYLLADIIFGDALEAEAVANDQANTFGVVIVVVAHKHFGEQSLLVRLPFDVQRLEVVDAVVEVFCVGSGAFASGLKKSAIFTQTPIFHYVEAQSINVVPEAALGNSFLGATS
jgi:hypothetical protein